MIKSMTTTPPPLFWISPSWTKLDAICFGTGRFLRAVWVPALQAAQYHPILIQPRGRSFVDYCCRLEQSSSVVSWPVDTVLASGDIQTDHYDCYGAFSFGTERDQEAFYQWKRSASLDTTTTTTTSQPLLIAVGVTEAGLASADTEAMQQLHRLLLSFMDQTTTTATTTTAATKICVINTDNVPNNGNVIRAHMLELTLRDDDDEQTKRQFFLNERVVFLNSMVDRITSHRPNDPLVPRAEPQPAKALVVADLQGDLPPAFHHIPGIVLRSTMETLQQDMVYKLRIANGTHTAVAHALALCSFPHTDLLSSCTARASTTFMTYLDALVQDQILVPLPPEAGAVWEDWRRRLLHPHFGLSSFFIAQNGAAKGGIRLGPTVGDWLRSSSQPTVTVAMAWAFAVLLRWLTPAAMIQIRPNRDTRYRGWLSQCSREQVGVTTEHSHSHSNATEEYADQLAFNLQEGWYDFRCTCAIQIDQGECNLSDCLAGGKDVDSIVRAYLVAEQGGNLQNVSHLPYFDVFVAAVSHLYGELVAKNNVLDSLEQLVQTNALGQDCRTLLVSDEGKSATN